MSKATFRPSLRQFLGKLDVPRTYDEKGNPTMASKAKKRFEQKKLKHYLRGNNEMILGFGITPLRIGKYL